MMFHYFNSYSLKGMSHVSSACSKNKRVMSFPVPHTGKHMKSICPITGDVNIDHLVKVVHYQVSLGYNYFFSFVANIYLVGRYFF